MIYFLNRTLKKKEMNESFMRVTKLVLIIQFFEILNLTSRHARKTKLKFSHLPFV